MKSIQPNARVVLEYTLRDERGEVLDSSDAEDGEPIVITTLRYSDGWAYRLEIPEQVDGPRLVKSLAQVLLLELANRNARARQAELPLWLTEGLTAHLQATALPNFTLEPDTRIIRKHFVQIVTCGQLGEDTGFVIEDY